MPDRIVNVVLAGLGGQGVIKASDILAEAAFRAGFDVKKSEIHGMSQRGGSVASDVRYGREVLSPMVPPGEADFLVVMERTQVAPNRRVLREEGLLLTPEHIPYFDREGDDGQPVVDRRMLNVALLGVLSAYLEIPEVHWTDAIRAHVPPRALDANLGVFVTGRTIEKALSGTPNGRTT